MAGLGMNADQAERVRVVLEEVFSRRLEHAAWTDKEKIRSYAAWTDGWLEATLSKLALAAIVRDDGKGLARARRELLDSAAIAVAMVEAIDRRAGR